GEETRRRLNHQLAVLDAEILAGPPRDRELVELILEKRFVAGLAGVAAAAVARIARPGIRAVPARPGNDEVIEGDGALRLERRTGYQTDFGAALRRLSVDRRVLLIVDIEFGPVARGLDTYVIDTLPANGCKIARRALSKPFPVLAPPDRCLPVGRNLEG